MVTMNELRDLKPSVFETAADGWGRVSHHADHARHQVDQGMAARLRASEQGETATAALADLQRLSANYQYIHAETGLVRATLNALAADLTEPQRALRAALDEAASLEFTVHDDGSVSYPTAVPFAPGLPSQGASDDSRAFGAPADPNKAKAQDIADRIAAAVRRANEIDARYTKLLSRLTTTRGLKVTDATWADEAKDLSAVNKTASPALRLDDIPKGTSPTENATWWKHLSPEQRDEYAALYPARVGALDGLPSTVRDSANRIVLAETYAKTRQEWEQWKKREPTEYDQYYDFGGRRVPGAGVHTKEWEEWNKRATDLRGKLDGMEAIEDRFASTGIDRLPEAYLLGIDTENHGHAIIANGNPDTADHTAVFVPGTTAKLQSSKDYIGHMANLWKAADNLAPGQQVSTITWIGYDAPQTIVPEAMSKSYAHHGAPILNQFLDGLQTVQGGPQASHTTVIGHSYGSTVVGDASNQGRLPADEVIAAGSPGMLVGRAEDLDVGADHTWSEAAGVMNDKVPIGGKIAGLGGSGFYPRTWHGIPYDADLNLDVVPSDRGFGANIMKTDARDHGDYWRSPSIGLRNQAAVITENYKLVKPG